MTAHRSLQVTLDPSAQEILNWLKEEGHFSTESILIQEALHALYRELHQPCHVTVSKEHLAYTENLSPDDFE